MRRRRGRCCFVLALATAVGLSAASMSYAVDPAVEALQATVRQLEQTVQLLQQRVAQLEGTSSAGATADVALTERVEQLEAEKSPSWVESWKLKGDLRYRHEWSDRDDSSTDRHRHRVRARLGFFGKVNDDVDAGVQLASGTDSPTSTNQTLDTFFTSKDVWLDLMYFDWHPAVVPGLHVLGGKTRNPFAQPVGNSDLMFDNDLNPEGLCVTWDRTVGNPVDVFVNLAGYWIDERGGDADSSLWAAQGGLQFALPLDGSDMKVGAGYYYYNDIEGRALFDPATSGNWQTTAGTYAEGFRIVEAFAQIGFDLVLPVKVFGHYAHNTEADLTGDDDAWLVGVKLGKRREPWSWDLAYNYRRIEPDAVFGAFTDATAIPGGTDGECHKISFALNLARNWDLAISYYDSQIGLDREIDSKEVDIDLNYKF